MIRTKIEFAVQMTCEACTKSIAERLKSTRGIEEFDVDLKTGSVTVQTVLSAEEVLKVFEDLGRKAVVRGLGGLSAGVAILDTGSTAIKGVVRFVQQREDLCIVDGTVDGLQPGKHRLSVHECGDISEGCTSVGEIFRLQQCEKRIYGDLGIVEANQAGRAAFRFDDNVIKLSEIIGRSLVISDLASGQRIACGILARSAGLFENPKTICTCDGLTIWNEKVQPTAASL